MKLLRTSKQALWTIAIQAEKNIDIVCLIEV